MSFWSRLFGPDHKPRMGGLEIFKYIGPGSVSVILTLMASVSMKDGWAKGLLSYAIIALVIVLMCLILYLFLSQGERIIRKIGTSGSIVINKMVAFFTFCVGVQIVVTGIAKLFHLHL